MSRFVLRYLRAFPQGAADRSFDGVRIIHHIGALGPLAFGPGSMSLTLCPGVSTNDPRTAQALVNAVVLFGD